MDLFQDNQADDHHVFVSDGEWMKELGLGTFTTGTLYDWWYAQDEQKQYMNRAFVNQSSSDVAPDIFFKNDGPMATGSMEPWRFTGDGKGKYQKRADPQSHLATWGYVDERDRTNENPMQGIPYSVGDLDLAS